MFRAQQKRAMNGISRQWVGRETEPVDLVTETHGPRRVDNFLRLQAARRLVALATSLVRTVERGYRAGYLGLAQVEYCVHVSANLRRRACGLIGTRGDFT
jgi:hypothetical protein